MSVIFVLAGGLFGFASAIASLILLDASPLFALAIWSGSGLTVVAFGFALSLLARRTPREKSKPLSADAHPV